jgi:hypothetical protein
MGHSTLAMMVDTYGHRSPSRDDAEVLAAGEAALMRALYHGGFLGECEVDRAAPSRRVLQFRQITR